MQRRRRQEKKKQREQRVAEQVRTERGKKK
jgi:hypothetical protein